MSADLEFQIQRLTAAIGGAHKPGVCEETGLPRLSELRRIAQAEACGSGRRIE